MVTATTETENKLKIKTVVKKTRVDEIRINNQRVRPQSAEGNEISVSYEKTVKRAFDKEYKTRKQNSD